MSTQAKSDPELVGVFETEQESEAMVVHGLLTSAGIESVVTSIDAPQNIFPGVGGVVVRVNAAQAEEARRLIDEYNNSADNADEIDLDDSGTTATE
ncbi:MAG: putative signal transducing protein [Candidatus Angelobacter sp.]